MLIEVRTTKAVLFLYPDEIIKLLNKEPELFTLALKRGKGILRYRETIKNRKK